MATFIRQPIEPGTPGQTVWKKIRDLLVTNESVEVVVKATEDSDRFELRAWTRVRNDSSNSQNAVPGTDY